MDLAFGDREIRRVCEDSDKAVEVYGVQIAEALHNRLADLSAATSLSDIIVGRPAQLSDNTFKIDISGGYRLVFSANDRKLTYNAQGSIDWLSVTRIRITSIELHA